MAKKCKNVKKEAKTSTAKEAIKIQYTIYYINPNNKEMWLTKL